MGEIFLTPFPSQGLILVPWTSPELNQMTSLIKAITLERLHFPPGMSKSIVSPPVFYGSNGFVIWVTPFRLHSPFT